ncbi:RNB domain-containing ribonuclease [Sphingomonas ginkgonis]|uniref:Ribonuclease R n=1 Tax=Sphingomonas ginkgonis TaxID=2315330 RepID=A0A3R9YLT9_9SPHN|nr:RNB domain-containing ribonuclease [Sphingomonas ginkgonis]RST30447.1 RNB domain-containing ribonuclease [Sphingomonas ginkgonis]
MVRVAGGVLKRVQHDGVGQTVPRRPTPGLPTRQQILDFITQSGQPAGKREIARAFGLSGHDKIMLKALLKDMADEGLIDSSPGRAFHKSGGVPRVTVLRVVEVDSGPVAIPENWQGEEPPPKLRILEQGRRGALALNDRVLVRTEERGNGHVAHLMKKLAKSAELVLGVVHQEGERFWLRPVDKRERRELPISDLGEAQPGDLVLCEPSGRPPKMSARVDAILGDPFAPRSFSLIAIHKHGLPHEFREETIEEAARVAKLPLGADREDLRHLPIVAIDPADARDHDDAIWAEADGEGGWRAIVAIADVSFYVRSGSALDREARRRGNSVYFPDRVVPMLPHELSSGICSLKAGQDRAALACHLAIAKDGAVKSWRFSRAVIRVAANIAYEDAQAAMDALLPETSLGGGPPPQAVVEGPSPSLTAKEAPPPLASGERSPSPATAGEERVPRELVDTALRPLWGCWRALLAARTRREPLELDLPERQIQLDEKGRILSVAPRERLDAHRLVEDYMIAANVAAAKALEAKKAQVMYRVHETPSREKLVALKDYLDTFGISFALGQVVRPATFNRIIAALGDSDARPEIMEQVLRTQTQARYAPDNLGHFGLALGSYAHFTSPIRRYADLLVHRSLVRAYNLGEGGLSNEESEHFGQIGESISMLERRAMEAERETIDRYVAAYLSDHVGELVQCRITGVQPFGFFATVEGLGGDGLVPAGDLGTEYYRYDEAARALTGEASGDSYRVGQRLTLRLVEANPVSGALRFQLPEGSYGGARQRPERRDRVRSGGMGRRGRPANIRHQGRKKR